MPAARDGGSGGRGANLERETFSGSVIKTVFPHPTLQNGFAALRRSHRSDGGLLKSRPILKICGANRARHVSNVIPWENVRVLGVQPEVASLPSDSCS